MNPGVPVLIQAYLFNVLSCVFHTSALRPGIVDSYSIASLTLFFFRAFFLFFSLFTILGVAHAGAVPRGA
jgi:hypothetical protein